MAKCLCQYCFTEKYRPEGLCHGCGRFGDTENPQEKRKRVIAEMIQRGIINSEDDLNKP